MLIHSLYLPLGDLPGKILIPGPAGAGKKQHKILPVPVGILDVANIDGLRIYTEILVLPPLPVGRPLLFVEMNKILVHRKDHSMKEILLIGKSGIDRPWTCLGLGRNGPQGGILIPLLQKLFSGSLKQPLGYTGYSLRHGSSLLLYVAQATSSLPLTGIAILRTLALTLHSI